MHRPLNHGMASKPFRATYIWSSIIGHLQAQVEVKRRRHNLKSYDDCFLGSEAVDVILEHISQNKFFGSDEIPREKVVRVCQFLMEYKVFEPVGTKVFGKDKKQSVFEDSSYSLYRFINEQSPSMENQENNQENGCRPPVDPRIVYRTHAIRLKMARKKELPLETRQSIVVLRKEGYSTQEIENLKSLTMLSTTPFREQHKQALTRTEKRSGRPQCTTVQEDKYLNDDPEYLKSSPVRSQRSFEGHPENNVNPSNIQLLKENTGLSQSLVNEVWWEQTLLRLLQLVELPLLDSLLECRESRLSTLRSADSDPDLLYTSSYLDREILQAFGDSQADGWLSAAVDCLEFLPDRRVVEVSRGLPRCSETPQCKRLLFDVLEKHYSQTHRPALLSAHTFDIHIGISDLLVNGKLEQALEALQLCLNLLDSQRQEELRRLLRFMYAAADPRELRLHKEIENRMAVKRAFSRAIVHRKHLAKGKVDLLVLFMMDNHREVFKVPESLHQMVRDKLQYIINRMDLADTTGPATRQRVASKIGRDKIQKTTEDELLALIRTIHKNPTLSAKEKKRLLGQFYKAHPDTFVQYLGNRMSTIDV